MLNKLKHNRLTGIVNGQKANILVFEKPRLFIAITENKKIIIKRLKEGIKYGR